MQTVESDGKMAAFEAEPGRVYYNANERTVQRDGGWPSGEDVKLRTAYLYDRYTALGDCDLAVMEADAATWGDWVMAEDKAIAAAAVRKNRDLLLCACDGKMAADATTDKAAWGAYRQALRDVPEQAGFPYAVEWPVEP